MTLLPVELVLLGGLWKSTEPLTGTSQALLQKKAPPPSTYLQTNQWTHILIEKCWSLIDQKV